MEDLLIAMEARLSAKIEKTVRLADLTNEGLDQLELKVNANEAKMRAALVQSEGRIMEEVGRKVKGMVDDQLRAAGFDQDLSAADLSVRRLVTLVADSYARVAAGSIPASTSVQRVTKTKEEKQEDNFWLCRRSLKLWPVKGCDRADLDDFFLTKLRMDQDHGDELGEIRIFRERLSKNKGKDEVIAVFESKQQ